MATSLGKCSSRTLQSRPASCAPKLSFTHPVAQTSRCLTVCAAVEKPPKPTADTPQAFNEGFTQVRRLVSRDKKTFLGNRNDILEKFETEFDEGPTAFKATSSTTASEAAAPSAAAPSPTPAKAVPTPSAAASANPFSTPIGLSSASSSGRPVSADNPFKAGPATASPFGSAPAAKPFKQSIEPVGLNPDMEPDAIVKEAPFDFLKSITLTQGVIAGSFVFVIVLMLATFNVAVNAGAIRLAGI